VFYYKKVREEEERIIHRMRYLQKSVANFAFLFVFLFSIFKLIGFNDNFLKDKKSKGKQILFKIVFLSRNTHSIKKVKYHIPSS